jgi:uncharacterized membrane protein
MTHADATPSPPEAALRFRTERTLYVGFLVATALIVAGTALSAILQQPFPDTLGTPLDVVRGVVQGDAASVIGLGILAIILTPFVAAGVITWSFLQEGDRRYAAISGSVLLILLLSMVASNF